MPDWQIVDEAYARLLKVRTAFDEALALVIEGRNAGAQPVLDILANEVDALTRAVLAAFGAEPHAAGEPAGMLP